MKDLLTKYGKVKVNIKEPEISKPYYISECILPIKVCEEINDKSFSLINFSNILNKERPNNLEKLEQEEINFIEDNESFLKVFDVIVLAWAAVAKYYFFSETV